LDEFKKETEDFRINFILYKKDTNEFIDSATIYSYNPDPEKTG
jgi:hypothetical protein